MTINWDLGGARLMQAASAAASRTGRLGAAAPSAPQVCVESDF